MRHTLLSQLQGAFLGAAIGEFLGTLLAEPGFKSDTLRLGFIHPFPLAANTGQPLALKSSNSYIQLHPSTTKALSLAVLSADSLIRCHGFNLQDWRDIWETQPREDSRRHRGVSPSSQPSYPFTPEVINPNSPIEPQMEVDASGVSSRHPIDSAALTPSEAAIAALPMAFLFHEQEGQMRQKLQPVADLWIGMKNPLISAYLDGMFAVGYAISQAFQEKLNPLTLLPEIIAALGVEASLAQQLQTVETLLAQKASLETAINHLCKDAKGIQLQKNPSEAIPQNRNTATPVLIDSAAVSLSNASIALAFYCFLSTLEEMRLAMIRAAKTGFHSPITCAITGILSGAYNSYAAIPIEWKMVMGGGSQAAITQETNFVSQGTSLNRGLMELTTNLLAVWSGVYNPTQKAPESRGYDRCRVRVIGTVAAPHVIRPIHFRTGK